MRIGEERFASFMLVSGPRDVGCGVEADFGGVGMSDLFASFR